MNDEKTETISLAEHEERMAERLEYIVELQQLILTLQSEIHDKRIRILKLEAKLHPFLHKSQKST